jgi:hypothetical protein
MGSLVGGRKPYQTTEQHDTIDGDITCQVIRLVNSNEQWVNQVQLSTTIS